MGKQAVTSQRGFTLIELLAVMAIIAILAAIVAPAVSGTKDAGADAQAVQDAMQVRTGSNEYFTDQDTVEVVSADTAITSLQVKLATTNGQAFDGSNTATTTASVTQKTSSRWPEKFITSSSTSTALYYTELPVSGSTTIGTVYFVDKVVTDPDDDGTVISANELLGNYTAIDVDTLVSKDYLEAAPQSADAKRELDNGTTTVEVHALIWLFKKVNTPGSDDAAGRDIRVFKLTTATKSGSNFILTYERIF